MSKEIKLTRGVRKNVERELWGRAAARCQFPSCNKLLYKHSVTQEPLHLAEKAHIYSFSEMGPRGWGAMAKNLLGLNDISNLILVCPECHLLIDGDPEGRTYSALLLKQWKSDHEMRVREVTGISLDRRSHVVLYGARIGEEKSPLSMARAHEAMIPDWFAASDCSIDLSMCSAFDDSMPEYWESEARNLRLLFKQKVRDRIEKGVPNHFSVFARAPQPLLILLGALFTDKVPARVYQQMREPSTWRWQERPIDFQFSLRPPISFEGPPVVLIALSDKVDHNRILDEVGPQASIWEVSANQCHNDILRSESQLSDFRQLMRKLFVEIREKHQHAERILIFPVMPLSCAVELGRVRMPKADLPWDLYDQDRIQNRFIKRLTVGESNE